MAMQHMRLNMLAGAHQQAAEDKELLSRLDISL
jgi:hypothetical protein